MRCASLLIAFATLLPLSITGCGKSGSRETRPIEVLYHVSGATGTQFRILPAEEARPECPGGNLRALNAIHGFGNRIFETPHLFILENAFQPTSGTFELLADQTDPIDIDLFLGTDQFDFKSINPGECVNVFTEGELDAQLNQEYRVEICGSIDDPPQGSKCGDFPDAFVGFFLSAGDSKQSIVSTCNLQDVSETCRTPATVFIEQPKDQIDVIVDTNSDVNRDAVLTVELYINGKLVDSSKGRRNVQVSKDL